MRTLTDAHLADARALGVRAGLRGEPTPSLTAASLWELVMSPGDTDFDRTAPRRLLAAFHQGAQAHRLGLAIAHADAV